MNTIPKEILFHVLSYLKDKHVVRLIFVSKWFLPIMPLYDGLKNTYTPYQLKSQYITIKKINIGNNSFAICEDAINNYRRSLEINHTYLQECTANTPIQCDPRHTLSIYIEFKKMVNTTKMLACMIMGSNGVLNRADIIFIETTKTSLDELDKNMSNNYGVSLHEFLKEYKFNIAKDEQFLTQCFSSFCILKKEKRFIINQVRTKEPIRIHEDPPNFVHMDKVYYRSYCCNDVLNKVKLLHLESSVISIKSGYHFEDCSCSYELETIDLSSYTSLSNFTYNHNWYERIVIINDNIKYITIVKATVPIIDKYPIGVIKISTDKMHGIIDLLKRRNVPIYFRLCLYCEDLDSDHKLTYTKSCITIDMDHQYDHTALDMCEELPQYNGSLIVKPEVVLDTWSNNKQTDTFLGICKLLIFILYECDYTKYPNTIYLLKNNKDYINVNNTIT